MEALRLFIIECYITCHSVLKHLFCYVARSRTDMIFDRRKTAMIVLLKHMAHALDLVEGQIMCF